MKRSNDDVQKTNGILTLDEWNIQVIECDFLTWFAVCIMNCGIFIDFLQGGAPQLKVSL